MEAPPAVPEKLLCAHDLLDISIADRLVIVCCDPGIGGYRPCVELDRLGHPPLPRRAISPRSSLKSALPFGRATSDLSISRAHRFEHLGQCAACRRLWCEGAGAFLGKVRAGLALMYGKI